ncbi:hypothetical protein LG579_004598, partial [Vibrio parahaemolyticus]|nr:hypothetical protein [Vibrio parahaemolyticus]
MSRLIISNSEILFKKLLKSHNDAGLSLCEEFKHNGMHLASFYKRVRPVENCTKYDGTSFAIASGTYTYEGDIGRNALCQALKCSENDEDFRNKFIGNYSIALSKGDVVEVYCDPYAIHDLYYFYENGQYAISNSLRDIAKLKENLSLMEENIVSETILAGYIGNETIFKGIYKLRGSEKLEITDNVLEVVNLGYKKKEWTFEGKTIDDAAQDYANLITKYSHFIAKGWGDNGIGIHQTGGLDNRLIFSAFMNLEISPTLLYGKGNSILTTTNKEDLDCVLEYGKKFGLNTHIMNWGHSREDFSLEFFESLFEKYGFKCAIYGAPKAFFSEYEGRIPDYPSFLEFGYFGENLRLREYVGSRSFISINEFFDDYLFGGRYGDINSVEFLPHSNTIKQKLKKQYLNEAKLFDLDFEEVIPAERFDEFRWVHARKADSRSLNLINEFTCSFSLLSVPELHEFPWSLPADWRRSGEFQLRVINKLFPQALDIKVFSHGNMQKFDRNNFNLNIDYSYAQKIKSLMDQLGINKDAVAFFKKLYFQFLEKDRGKAELAKKNISSTKLVSEILDKYLNEDCPKELKFINPNHYPGHIVGLYRYYLHI